MLKNNKSAAAFLAAMVMSVPFASAQDNNQKEKEPEEIAAEMVTKMESQLSLEPHQCFYIDSILSHDYREWTNETKAMQASGVQEVTVYKAIREKWSVQIDSSIKKVLTEQQWTEYLKMTGQYKKTKKRKDNQQ